MKLPALLGIIRTQDRETYQPTSIMRWDNHMFICSENYTIFYNKPLLANNRMVNELLLNGY